MEDDIPSFPLLNLPNAPLRGVLQNMEIFHLLGFSILSKRSKKLVESLKLKAEVRQLNATIKDVVSISVWPRKSFPSFSYFWFYTKELRRNQLSSTEIYTPDFVCAREDLVSRTYYWKKQGFEIKDWIDHFLSILNHSKLDRLSFSGEVLFDLKSLRKTITDISEIRIEDTYPVVYIQQIVQAYPSAKICSLFFDTTSKLEDYHNILCQGFDVLIVNSNAWNGTPKCNLDELLILNSRRIILWYSSLTEKEFNSFLKHWMNGSNSRMENIAIRFLDNRKPNENIILNGLNCLIVSPDQERMFKQSVKDYDESSEVLVKGGYDIHRIDGTTATIVFHEVGDDQFFHLEVFVWH